MPGLIRYEHHQGQIVVAALLLQLPDCVFGIRKCRRNIWQVDTIRTILDPVSSVYRKEISRHRSFSPSRVFCRAERRRQYIRVRRNKQFGNWGFMLAAGDQAAMKLAAYRRPGLSRN